MRTFSNPHFLAIYSGLLTVAFFLTVSLGLARGDFTLHRLSASEQRDPRHRTSMSLPCIASISLSRTVLLG